MESYLLETFLKYKFVPIKAPAWKRDKHQRLGGKPQLELEQKVVLAVSPEATSQLLGVPRHQAGDPSGFETHPSGERISTSCRA